MDKDFIKRQIVKMNFITDNDGYHPTIICPDTPEQLNHLRETKHLGDYRYQGEDGKIKWYRWNMDWFISKDGDMMFIDDDYIIYVDQLKDDDWILHLMEKWWFDANTFIPAYFEACKRAGIRNLSIITHY